MTSRIIESEADVEGLVRLLKARKLPLTVSIAQGRNRTHEQNRLQHLWHKEVADQLGDRTPDDVRAYCKLHIGVSILLAGNSAFQEKYDRVLGNLSYEDKLEMMLPPFDLPVTSLMTTRQKKEFLDRVHRTFSQLGVQLTDPEHLLGSPVQPQEDVA